MPALPEEKVRQRLLQRMLKELGYPAGLVAVEKDIFSLPHVIKEKCPVGLRRADILCFMQNIDQRFSCELYPLLLIECKAVALSQQAERQLLGYNHYVQACFIALANQAGEKTFWFDARQQKYCSVDFLPSYQQLLLGLK